MDEFEMSEIKSVTIEVRIDPVPGWSISGNATALIFIEVWAALERDGETIEKRVADECFRFGEGTSGQYDFETVLRPVLYRLRESADDVADALRSGAPTFEILVSAAVAGLPEGMVIDAFECLE